MHRAILELLQQPFDIFEFLLSAARLAGTPAQLFQNFARTRQIGLIGQFDDAACHRSVLVQRPPQRIELLLTLLLIALPGLLAILCHHVPGHFLGALPQLVEDALLTVCGGTELTAGKIIFRLPHRAAGFVEPTRNLHAVLCQALDDLVELVA